PGNARVAAHPAVVTRDQLCAHRPSRANAVGRRLDRDGFLVGFIALIFCFTTRALKLGSTPGATVAATDGGPTVAVPQELREDHMLPKRRSGGTGGDPGRSDPAECPSWTTLVSANCSHSPDYRR